MISDEMKTLLNEARTGDPKAQYNLAVHYALGEELEQDLQKARYWYQRAADSDFAPGWYGLGYMHKAGEGGPVDYTQAISCFQKAAEGDFAHAQFVLALALEDDRHTPQDMEKALYWYRSAAAQREGKSAASRENGTRTRTIRL